MTVAAATLTERNDFVTHRKEGKIIQSRLQKNRFFFFLPKEKNKDKIAVLWLNCVMLCCVYVFVCCVLAHWDLPVLLLVSIHNQQPVWDGLTVTFRGWEFLLTKLLNIGYVNQVMFCTNWNCSSYLMSQCSNANRNELLLMPGVWKPVWYVFGVSLQVPDGQLLSANRVERFSCDF